MLLISGKVIDWSSVQKKVFKFEFCLSHNILKSNSHADDMFLGQAFTSTVE
jgi:hypothetical protein